MTRQLKLTELINILKKVEIQIFILFFALSFLKAKNAFQLGDFRNFYLFKFYFWFFS